MRLSAGIMRASDVAEQSISPSPMRVWITMSWEPLPTIDEGARMLRCGLLARQLASDGHDVIWWTSTFDHLTKTNRFERDASSDAEARLRIEMLHGPGYARNISFRRLLHNRALARSFRRRTALEEQRPDAIYAVVPTVELADASVSLGRKLGVPVIVDVRDTWPDVYLKAVPKGLRWLARIALGLEYRRSARVFALADSVVAVSPSYLTWACQRGRRPPNAMDRVFPLGYRAEHLTEPAVDARSDELSETLALMPETRLVTYLGQFGASYDVETIVETARIFAARGDASVRFVLAGDGDKLAALRKAARLLPNVTFTGWLDAVSSLALLRRSTIGLVAYTAAATQSLPNKPFDYMAAGLPLLSSLVGDLPRIIDREQIGAHYDAGNALSMATAIDRMLADSGELRRMRERAFAIFKRDYDAHVIYPALASHVVTVAGRHAQRSR
jgi:glycosyltransferase involved in cell wall biosynthesis